MEEWYAALLASLETWGYPAIVVGMAMESACLPVPSELIFGFAGYLVFLGRLDFSLTVAAGVAGGLAGSILAYLAGCWGGRPFVARYGRYLFISQRQVDRAQRWFDRYGLQAVFWARLLPVVRTFISLPAGFARLPFGLFVACTLLGSLPWTVALVYAGMMLGENWRRLEAAGQGAAVVLLGLAALVWLRRRAGSR